ncbi:MAG: tetratricopeptide repeat protein [Treponema sp.]|nr:tetratricopeptide repeat protein [Treponema sp.]
MDKLILERAQSAMLSRDYGLAARLYKTLLKAEPDNAEILNALGSLYVKNGEDDKAVPYYETILTFTPHDVYAMNSLGGIYRRLKQYEKGIDILNRALEENNKTGMINYTLGFIYKDMGNWDDAIDCFESVVAENPADVLANNHLGAIYAEKKNYPKAVQAYRRGLQTDPNHPILHYNLGHAYEAERNYTEAVNNYELALKAKPGWIDAIRDAVKLLLKLQNTKRAMAIVQKSVQLYPTNADLIALSGTVQLKRYDFAEAQSAFERADRIRPNDPDILLRLGESFEKEYMPGEAASWAKEARVLGLKDNTQKKRYVHIMLSAGEFERANSLLEELIFDAPSDAGVMDAKAQYFIVTGDEAGAKEAFDIISDLNPRYRHHYLEAARRYCQIKKYDIALEYASKYVELAPLNPAGYNIKGRIEEKSGDLESAVKTYKIAANLKYEDVYAKKELKRLGHEWNENLQGDVSDYISKLNEKEKEEEAKRIMAEEQAAAELAEQIIEENVDSFDFDSMGDTHPSDTETTDPSIPLLSELSEDEGFSGLDSIDEDTKRLMEDEVEAKEDALSEIMSSKPKAETKPEKTESIDPEEFIPGWDEPVPSMMPQQYSAPQPGKSLGRTVDADIEDFMPSERYSANDAMNMLRQDTEEPRMDPRLVEKIDDAVENLEKAVSDVSDKAEEAIRKAEEAASQIQNINGLEERIGFSDPELSSNSFDAKAPEFSLDGGIHGRLGITETFGEPEFEPPFEIKDPFDNLVTPDLEPGYEELPEVEPDSAGPEEKFKNEEQTFDDAKKFLPNIVKIIEDENFPEKYKEELGLFNRLRSLSDFLPSDKKEDFLSSKTRMLMDYVIGKMSGKPGLVKTVENLLKSGILETDTSYSQIETEAAKLSGHELARKVINDLKTLTADLQDQNLATALKESADEVLKKL